MRAVGSTDQIGAPDVADPVRNLFGSGVDHAGSVTVKDVVDVSASPERHRVWPPAVEYAGPFVLDDRVVVDAILGGVVRAVSAGRDGDTADADELIVQRPTLGDDVVAYDVPRRTELKHVARSRRRKLRLAARRLDPVPLDQVVRPGVVEGQRRVEAIPDRVVADDV